MRLILILLSFQISLKAYVTFTLQASPCGGLPVMQTGTLPHLVFDTVQHYSSIMVFTLHAVIVQRTFVKLHGTRNVNFQLVVTF